MAEKRAFTLFYECSVPVRQKQTFELDCGKHFRTHNSHKRFASNSTWMMCILKWAKKSIHWQKKNSNKKIAEIFKSSKNQRKFAKIETEKEIECIDVKSVESEINLNGSYNCCYWTFFLIQCLVSRYLSAALLLDKKWQSTSKNRTKTKLNGMKYRTEVDVNQPRMGKESVSQITVSLCLTARLWKFTWKIASH